MPSLKSNQFRLYLPALASVALYALVLAFSLRAISHGIENQALASAVSLSPMIPGVLLCVAIVRLNRRQDERHRQIQLEAITIAFVGTALITFSYGFLENVGFPRLSAFAVWPLMATLWILAGIVTGLRYR